MTKLLRAKALDWIAARFYGAAELLRRVGDALVLRAVALRAKVQKKL